jgi:hypothetical protein
MLLFYINVTHFISSRSLLDTQNEIIIQFNSIHYYLCAESTATRPITDTTVQIHIGT